MTTHEAQIELRRNKQIPPTYILRLSYTCVNNETIEYAFCTQNDTRITNCTELF